VLPTGGKFKFGGDPNKKIDIGGGMGSSTSTKKKYDFSQIKSSPFAPHPSLATFSTLLRKHIQIKGARRTLQRATRVSLRVSLAFLIPRYVCVAF